jgi:hypothetical protein
LGLWHGRRPWDQKPRVDVVTWDFLSAIVLEAEVIQELSCRRACWLEVPSFVELRMVACFYNPRVQVQIDNVLVRCSVTKEDTREFVTVKFAPAVASAFHPDASSEQF